MRKLTDIHDYLEPLRRQGIRYVVEGERHFYAAKEIIDAVNLLRAVENPYDRLALVGVLRSPLGGLTDLQIYQLHRQNRLDYRDAAKLDVKEFPATLAQLYQALARLNEETRTLPIGAAVDRVFSTLPVELLAACHFHGEQAVANLAKLRQQAEQLGREGLTTLKQAIRQLEQRVLDVKDEGESVLAEENLDAVRIMSIHKAKGLEFPIVILAGCQTGTEGRHSAEAESTFDWSTGLTGTAHRPDRRSRRPLHRREKPLEKCRRTKTAALRRHDESARTSSHLLRTERPAFQRQLSSHARHNAGR